MSSRFPFLPLFYIALVLATSNGCRRASHTQGTAAAGPPTPGQIVMDKQGNLYVNQEGRSRVLKISSDRTVTVYAGTGEIGFSGDGGRADQARLTAPTSIALDPDNDLFIADTGNSKIRRVDATTRIITTVAGKNYAGNWDGANALYPDGLPAGEVPIAIAAGDKGDLYIGGPHGMGIRRLGLSGEAPVKVVANGFPGDPSSPFTTVVGPFWLAKGDQGAILYSQPDRNIVAIIDTPLFDVHRIAGGGDCGFAGDGALAAGALLCSPAGLATGTRHGRRVVLIADAGNNRVREVDLETGLIATVAGNGQAGYGGDGGPAVNASLHSAMAVALDANGNIYVADTGNDCIRKVDGSGIITTWVNRGGLQ